MPYTKNYRMWSFFSCRRVPSSREFVHKTKKVILDNIGSNKIGDTKQNGRPP